MPGPQPFQPGTSGVIDNLDYITLLNSQSTFGIPYIELGVGMTYMQNMQYDVWNDETTFQSYEAFDLPMLCLLGDIWGATAGQHQPPQPEFFETTFDSVTIPLDTNRAVFYHVEIVSPATNQTFGQDPFYQFGRVAFGYISNLGTINYGKSHWLEHIDGIIFPEAPNPVTIAIFQKQGCVVNWYRDASPTTNGAGVNVAGTVNSAVTGVLTAFGTN